MDERSRWLAIVLPLIIMAAANAAPTVNNCSNSFVDSAVSPSSDPHTPIVSYVTCTIESGNSHLAGVAAEFLKPPAVFTGSSTQPGGARSLPAVPGALLMGLTGFLCISLVKDRRVWLAALTGLLWVGQTGIQALPQLALRLCHRSHTEQLNAELTYLYQPENSRLSSDIESTQYIGLLYYLSGIPRSTRSFLLKKKSSKAKVEFRAPQSAIKVLHLIPATNCLAAKARQFTCFSPAFIFDNIPRGPPLLA